MNNIRKLRKQKGIQQKELALALGVANATVSDWELGKKDPSKERIKQLAEYFCVDEDCILVDPSKNYFFTESPETSGVSETDQIINRLLDKLGEVQQPRTPEARAVSFWMDELPEEQRKMIQNMVSDMYSWKMKKAEGEGTDET